MGRDSQTISVVIPVHDRADCIGRTIRSVLEQTRPAFEIIIVNDGSRDNTLDVCEKMSAPGLRIISLAERNGAQKARNAGIRAALGDWIAFLDSDDEWLPDQLEKLVARLPEVDFDPDTVVYCDCYVQTGRAEPRKTWRRPHVEGSDVFRETLMRGGPLFQGMLTSRKALQKMGLLDEAVQAYQEWETAIQLSRFCRFIHVQEPLFIYHRYSGESISGNPARRLDGLSYILNKYRFEIHARCGVEAWRRHLIHLFTLCYDLGMWSKKDFYRDLMAMTPRDEDRILVNLIINKMVDRDWQDAHILLKSVHRPWSIPVLTVSVLLYFHCSPSRLVSIKKRMMRVVRPARFRGKQK